MLEPSNHHGFTWSIKNIQNWHLLCFENASKCAMSWDSKKDDSAQFILFDRRQHQPRTIYWWIWYTKREILPGHLPFEILSTLLHLGPNFRITPWRISEGQSTVLRMLSVSQLGLCSDHDLYFSKGRTQQGINNGLQFREDPNEKPNNNTYIKFHPFSWCPSHRTWSTIPPVHHQKVGKSLEGPQYYNFWDCFFSTKKS